MRPTGHLVIYGSLGLRRGISDLLWAFRKANRMEEFPAYLDDHPFQVMERVRMERKHGLRTADVVLMPHYAVMALAREGLLGKVHPNNKSIPKNMRSVDGASIPIGATFMAMAYDSRRLKTSELPADIGNLGEKNWKGKLGAQSLTSSRSGNLGAWYLSFLKQHSKKQWPKFFNSLKNQNRPMTYDCIDHLLQGLVEGEISLAMTVYSLAYFREKTSGSLISLVPPENVPHMMTFTSAGLLSGSEQPASAKRFIDFLLSEPGQMLVGGIPGIAPILPGTGVPYDFEHSLDSSTAFHPTSGEVGATEKAVRMFRALGLP